MAIDTSSLQGKPWYFGAGIGVVLAALIVFGFQYLLVADVDKKIGQANTRIDELDKKIQAGRTAEKKLPQFRDEVRRLELELDKLKRILPSTRNTEEIIKKVKSLVDQGDFVLEKLVFPTLAEAAPPEPAEGEESTGAEEVYAEWPINVSIEGRYHDLAILFNRLANFSRIINVEKFTITALPAQLDRTIQADFVAKTFVYIEPKEGEGDEDGATPGGTAKGRK